MQREEHPIFFDQQPTLYTDGTLLYKAAYVHPSTLPLNPGILPQDHGRSAHLVQLPHMHKCIPKMWFFALCLIFFFGVTMPAHPFIHGQSLSRHRRQHSSASPGHLATGRRASSAKEALFRTSGTSRMPGAVDASESKDPLVHTLRRPLSPASHGTHRGTVSDLAARFASSRVDR